MKADHTFSDLIEVIPNALSTEFCQKCIQKFQEDDNKDIGKTGGGLNLDVKRSTDLLISSFDEWAEEDTVFYQSLSKHLTEYVDKWGDWSLANAGTQFKDTGYQIQETKPKDFYSWHNDFSWRNMDMSPRYLTFIWYLNDVTEDGYTEFIDGTKIQPEEGKLIIFPATWTYMHRGFPPKSETKYLCTGWVHSTVYNEPQ